MIDKSVLARAYELKQSTDLSFSEIERALVIRKGTLENSITKAIMGYDVGVSLVLDRVFDYLCDNGAQSSGDIYRKVDGNRQSIKDALKNLKDQGKIERSMCRVDRRVAVYRVAKWIV